MFCRQVALLLALLAPIHITAQQYAADTDRYQDKAVSVTGKVREISSNYGTVYLDHGVAARLTSKAIYNIGSVKVGQEITLHCVGAGAPFKQPLLLACDL